MSKQLRLPTLLVITDNPSIRFWTKKHLDDTFFLIHAQSSEEAIGALYGKIDFIVIDSEFAESDALEVCKEISKQSQKNFIPIFLITGRLKKSYRDRATQCGVTDFLSDQLDIEELQMRLEASKKSATSRQKTEDLASRIKTPLMTNGSLKNKFVLTDQALKLLASAKKENKPVALLLIRIDHTEKINHKEFLPQFTQFVNRFLRKQDLLMPTPDEGFAILLSNMTLENARIVAERLRKVIQEHAFNTNPITVSIVISSLEASEKGFSKMLESAAKSLKTQTDTNLIISLDEEST